MAATYYSNLRSAAGESVAVLCADECIVAIGSTIEAPRDAKVIDGQGRLLMPAFVEPHVHLDKTLWGEAWQPGITPSRLMDYIVNERKVLSANTTAIATRAGRLLERMLAAGTTAVRSHIDVAPDVGLSHVEAMLALRETWADRIDLQFVAFPQQGLLIQPGTLDLMARAVASGVETLGGLDPAGIDGDPDGQLRAIFGLAEKTGAGIDIHLHDKGDLGAWQIGRICDHVEAAGLQGRTMISHAYCLGMISETALGRLAERLAKLGVSLMTSAPADVAVPPVKALTAMGVNVCCGSDGIRDAWSPLGNGDMLERAFLTAYRFDWNRDEEFALALDCATHHAARAIGLEAYGLTSGARADFVMIDALNPGDALARRPPARRVVRAGRLLVDDGRLISQHTKASLLRHTLRGSPGSRPGSHLRGEVLS